MKISTEQWDEWLLAPVTDSISAESELAGIVACMKAQKTDCGVRISSPRLWVFRRLRCLWPLVAWGSEKDLSEILFIRARKVAVDLPELLYKEIISKPRRSDFIRWSWVRGVFGCTGSIYNPRRGYYCLMRLHDESVLRSVCELLEGGGVTPSVRKKDGVHELIIRDLQQIIRFCYFMGLSQAAQRLEERSLLRSNRNLANKQANCDSANIRRSLQTSRVSVAMIEFLRNHDQNLTTAGNTVPCMTERSEETHASRIPRKLIPLAKLRLCYPEATLSELGDKLRPQVSKSTVKYRLKKIHQIAEEAGFSLRNDSGK